MKTKIGKNEISDAVRDLAKRLKRLPYYNEVAVHLGIPCCQVNGLLGSLTTSDEDSLVVSQETGLPNGAYWNQTEERRKLLTQQAKEQYHRNVLKSLIQELGLPMELGIFRLSVKGSKSPKRLSTVEDHLKRNPNAILVTNGIRYTQSLR